MKKIVLVCGGIAGLITISWAIVSTNFLEKGVSYNTRLAMGYVTMILGFSMIYVGVKRFRDTENGGIITFGGAMKVASLITLVASTIYVVIWMIDYYFFYPNFGKEMLEATHAQLVAEGKTAAEIQQKMADMAKFMEMYKNPVVNALMTYTEIAPVGIVISLIVSLILKRRQAPVINA